MVHFRLATRHMRKMCRVAKVAVGEGSGGLAKTPFLGEVRSILRSPYAGRTGAKLAQRNGLGALLARVSGTSGTFRTVSELAFSAPLCQAALREGVCESATRLLNTASETRLLRHRSASLRDLPSSIFLR